MRLNEDALHFVSSTGNNTRPIQLAEEIHKSMKRKILIAGVAAAFVIGALLIPVGGSETPLGEKVKSVNMQQYGTEKPQHPLNMLFIHHSCGGQMLAPVGKDVGDNCIYQSNPNGGGLRELLTAQNYNVHEVSYGSELGENTDIFDWLPKFRDKMDKVLNASGQDTWHPEGVKNNIVAFKSCFPNNGFTGGGETPGNPDGPTLTVANAKATYTALLSEFEKQPDVLFVAVTAPPLLGARPEPAWKKLARVALGKDNSRTGPFARTFNNWLKSKDGWLKGYSLNNVAVFDYYDVLTKEGASDFLQYPSGPNKNDNHPSSAGNSKAAKAFVPFLNGAVNRIGLGNDKSAASDSSQQ